MQIGKWSQEPPQGCLGKHWGGQGHGPEEVIGCNCQGASGAPPASPGRAVWPPVIGGTETTKELLLV